MVAIGPTLSEVEERKGDEEQSRELEEIRVRERILHCSFVRSIDLSRDCTVFRNYNYDGQAM